MADTVLVTGGAGFIGYHVCKMLAMSGYEVIAVDNLNDYYSVDLKKQRIGNLQKDHGVKFIKSDITKTKELIKIMGKTNARYVVHLAGQAGVRYSQIDPMSYTIANLVGTNSVMDACKIHRPEHFLYASSSSVYGNATLPFREDDNNIEQLSYYAVTKRTNELTARIFNKETNIPTTGLRFFTAYGPWGRPDMAYWSFTSKILKGEIITVYGDDVARDYTYCDDVSTAVCSLLTIKPETHHVVNIGSQQPVTVLQLVESLERSLGKRAYMRYMDLPNSEPQITCCDNSYLESLTQVVPRVNFDEGITKFTTWFQKYKL